MPSVSACVFREGEVAVERVLGLADVATAREATADDVYRIGSITKTFTAVLVMQLVAEGRLELESSSAPTCRRRRQGRRCAWRWPSHRSPARAAGGGLGVAAPTHRAELLASLEDAELVLAPGELWHYSNLVFALLGEIVMRVRRAAVRGHAAGAYSRPARARRTSLLPRSHRRARTTSTRTPTSFTTSRSSR